jgi:hypothetical protein
VTARLWWWTLGEVEDDSQSRRTEEGLRRRAGELTARVSAGCTMNAQALGQA